MGCCMGKKVLKILAGLVLVLVSVKMLWFDPWLVLGLYLLLAGIAPFLCSCDCCAVETKRKK